MVINKWSLLLLISVLTLLLSGEVHMARAQEANELPSIEKFYNTSTIDNMQEKVVDFYDENVEFVDPVGKIIGRKNLTQYYTHMYENLIAIHFDFHETITQGSVVFTTWTMKLKHKKVNSGDEIIVEGGSHIKFKNAKAVYHRDYFDLGAMVYEHVPVLGSVTNWIKSKMQFHADLSR